MSARRSTLIVMAALVAVATVLAVVQSSPAGDTSPDPGQGQSPPGPTPALSPTASPPGTGGVLPEPTASPDGPSPEPSPGPSPAEGGMVEFVDQEAGFALSHPAGWERIVALDPEVRLAATPNQQDALLVRALPLEGLAGSEDERQQLAEMSIDSVEDLPAIRPFTDRAIHQGEDVREVLAGPEVVQLGGLPGYFYFYRFADPASERLGAHAHYFAFRGQVVYVIILQALPAEGFSDLQPVFTRIIDSFRTLPPGGQ